MPKYNIDNLIIETTRRCNMFCEHCLRGKQQNINLDLKYVDELFKQIDYINTITFTGGEPSLVPEKITGIIELAKKYNIGINSFYIATNGKQVSNDFLLSVMQLYLYCDDNEISQLKISQDNYHDEINRENEKLLTIFSFAKLDEDQYTNKSTINEGYAEKNYLGGKDLSIYTIELDDNNITEGDLYLNCKGNLLGCCDLSYEHQDNELLIIGNVMQKDFDLFKSINSYNEKLDDNNINVVMDVDDIDILV